MHLTFVLNISNDHVAKYKLGGYVIGDQGCKIRKFTDTYNKLYTKPGCSQFLRIRGMGTLYQLKPRLHGKDINKRRGPNRFEMSFEVYEPKYKDVIEPIAEEFMYMLNDMVLFYRWQLHIESRTSEVNRNSRVVDQSQHSSLQDIFEE